jgi:hypothetical protein
MNDDRACGGGHPSAAVRRLRRRLGTGAAGYDDEDERTRREEKALRPWS